MAIISFLLYLEPTHTAVVAVCERAGAMSGVATTSEARWISVRESLLLFIGLCAKGVKQYMHMGLHTYIIHIPSEFSRYNACCCPPSVAWNTHIHAAGKLLSRGTLTLPNLFSAAGRR